MRSVVLALVVVVLYVLHQDFWLWRSVQPLVFGVFPVGLFYHAAYCVAIALALLVMVRMAWPSHLDPGSPAHE
jgi:hypothetical protein